MSNEPPKKQEVTVTDVRMPFGSMVVFMVKWAVASIPALLILAVLGSVVGFYLFAGLAAWSLHRSSHQPDFAAAGPAPNPVPAPKTIQASPEELAYLTNVVVRNIHVGTDVLDEKGAFGEVKNTGDRTLKEVEITIYCLAADGRPVFETRYHPVLVTAAGYGDSNLHLKPGYSRRFGVKLDDAPSDWAKKVDVKVTHVEFQ